MSTAEALVWTVWLGAGIAWEVRGFFRKASGDMLTEFKREWILHTAFGSSVVGAFLVWLVWHWLFDIAGLGWEDVVAAATGAYIGLLGWIYRRSKNGVL